MSFAIWGPWRSIGYSLLGFPGEILDTPIARLDGTPTTFGEITDGRAALVVNVASRCGLTPQYSGLEHLQETYGGERFTVVGFRPISSTARSRARPRTSPSPLRDVWRDLPHDREARRERRRQHELFAELTKAPNEKGEAGDVTWNFEKFLVAADGTVHRPVQPRRQAGGPAPGRRSEDPGLLEARGASAASRARSA